MQTSGGPQTSIHPDSSTEITSKETLNPQQYTLCPSPYTRPALSRQIKSFCFNFVDLKISTSVLLRLVPSFSPLSRLLETVNAQFGHTQSLQASAALSPRSAVESTKACKPQPQRFPKIRDRLVVGFTVVEVCVCRSRRASVSKFLEVELFIRCGLPIAGALSKSCSSECEAGCLTVRLKINVLAIGCCPKLPDKGRHCRVAKLNCLADADDRSRPPVVNRHITSVRSKQMGSTHIHFGFEPHAYIITQTCS